MNDLANENDLHRNRAHDLEKDLYDTLDPIFRCSPVAERMLEQIGVILWTAEAETSQLTYVGPQAEKIFGYPREDWYQSGFWLNHIHPDDRTKALSSRAMALAKSTEVHVDYRVLNRDGQYVNILDCVSSSQLPNNGPTVLSGIMVDVSHRTQVESLLAGQRRVLEILAGGASREVALKELIRVVEQQSQDVRCSVLILDSDGCYFKSAIAPSLPKAFSEYMIGMPIGLFSTPCGVAAFRKETVVVEDILNDPTWKRCRYFAVETGIRACWTTPIFSETNQVIGTFTLYFSESRLPRMTELQIANDTTNLARVIIEHARIRDSLQQSNSLLSATIESTTDGILVVDRVGRIVSFNKQFARLWQIPDSITESRDDAKALAFVVDQLKDPKEFMDIVQQLYNQPEVESFDVVEFKDGKTFERYSKAQKIGNEVIGRVWSFRDVTERRKAEKEAEAASRAKMHFLANISHEIRTPLGAIMGYSELLTSPGQTQDDLCEWEKAIKTNGAHLLQIVDEILDLSKSEFGKLSTDLTDFNLSEFVAEIEKTFMMKCKEKGIELRFSSEGPIPVSICTDKKKLRQILFNIIGNSVKFTEAGTVSVQVKYLAPSTLIFEVKDTGIGIDYAKRGSLFRPFEQVDDSYTRKFGGSGIGLALSKRFANSLGGDIVLVDSVPNVGTTFAINIDVSQTKKIRFTENLLGQESSSTGTLNDHPSAVSTKKTSTPCANTRPVEWPDLRSMRILLVEDLPDNQLLVSRFLTSMGAQVDIATNGSEGVERGTSEQHDLILMDIQMPVMDGYQATRELREKGYKGPIIAITAHAMKEEQELTKEAGCDGILVKPVSRQLLAETVKKYIPPETNELLH